MKRRLYQARFDFLQLGSPTEMGPARDPFVDVPDDLHAQFCRVLDETAAVDDLSRHRYSAALFEWEASRAAPHAADLSIPPDWQGDGRGHG